MSTTRRILLAAFIVETLCVTYALYVPWLVAVASVVYTVSGIAIAAALLCMPAQSFMAAPSKTLTRYRWLLVAAASLVMVQLALQWMEDEPLDHYTADMLPIIRVMCSRFLAGAWRHVYDPIPEIWQGTVPIYLPAMWLPFSLPQAPGVDLRWLTVLLFVAMLAMFVFRTHPKQPGAPALFGCAFLLFWWLFGVNKAGLMPYTEEAIVLFYYVLLAIILLRNKHNYVLIGLCASLCALSRYALAGWLPAMLLYFILRREWKGLLQFTATGIGCFLLLVLLPFGWGMIHSIFGLPGSYIEFAGRVWRDAPHVFSTSLGWAKFFGPGNIAQQHYLLIVLAFGVPLAAMAGGWWLCKKYALPTTRLPLVVLKVCLVVFFSFIDVPYLYLFYTSSFVSLFAVGFYERRKA